MGTAVAKMARTGSGPSTASSVPPSRRKKTVLARICLRFECESAYMKTVWNGLSVL